MHTLKEENGYSQNGGSRIASQERIIELHKRLHNHNEKTTNENDLDIEPQVKQERDIKPPRIRKMDVRKYLGDPLPLPYLTNPRSHHKPTQRNSHRDYHRQQEQGNKVPNALQPTKFQLRKPLGKGYQFEDSYREKLKDSLKNFQRSSSTATSQSRRSMDKTVQTENYDQMNIPITPNRNNLDIFGGNQSYTTPINSSGTYSQPYKLLVKDSNDIDFIISNFKMRNFESQLSTPRPENYKKLLDPFELSNESIIADANPIAKKKSFHIRLSSILGSPILSIGLIFLLIYILLLQS